MSKTNIEWTDATWNPVTGCSHAGSPGCDNCYARRMSKRLAGRYGYPKSPNQFDITCHTDRLDQPFKYPPVPARRIFVCSMGDLFHEKVHEDFIKLVFSVINRVSPSNNFQILTKRPGRMFRILTNWEEEDIFEEPYTYYWPLENVWLGVTVEHPDYLYRVDDLLDTPAAVRFVSIEPALRLVDLRHIDTGDAIIDALTGDFAVEGRGHTGPTEKRLHWVIVGGETGPGARYTDPDIFRSLRDQCAATGIPLFFKGHGTARMKKTDPDYRKLDGREWNEMPSGS